MLYSLLIVVFLSSPVAAKKTKLPLSTLKRVTFSIPYPSLYTCQDAQRLVENYTVEVGGMAARQLLPRRLAPFASETACVANATLGL